MKKAFVSLFVLSILLVGCNQSASSSEEIAKVAYDWEKATLIETIKTEQKLIYEEGIL